MNYCDTCRSAVRAYPLEIKRFRAIHCLVQTTDVINAPCTTHGHHTLALLFVTLLLFHPPKKIKICSKFHHEITK